MKIQNFSSYELAIFSSNYMNDKLPLPKKGQLYSKCGNPDSSCFLVFTDDYYDILLSFLEEADNIKEDDRLKILNKLYDINHFNDDISTYETYWLYYKEIKKIYSTIENKNEYGTLLDKEGNSYNTIKIGNQEWMAENLKSTKNNNGENIQYVESNSQWMNSEKGIYCWFNNDENNKSYGAIYNWHIINEDICPKGWKIPNVDDWQELKDYLNKNGYNYDGISDEWGHKIGKALADKEGWRDSEKFGFVGFEPHENNKSKFSGKPYGFRFGNGEFSNTPESACFWWSDESNNGMGKNGEGNYSVARSLAYHDSSLNGGGSYSKSSGFYLRLVKIKE